MYICDVIYIRLVKKPVYLLNYFFTYLLTYLLTCLLSYLLTYSMQHSPSSEADRFSASQ